MIDFPGEELEEVSNDLQLHLHIASMLQVRLDIVDPK